MDKFKVGDKVWVYDTVKAVASLEPSVLTENGVWVSAWKVRSAKNSMPPVLGAPYRLENNPAPAAAPAPTDAQLRSELAYERALVDDYERNYILPTFTWAKEYGIDLQKLVMDNAGKNCVELLVRALAAQPAPVRPDRPSVVGAKPVCLDCNKVGMLNCSHFDECDGQWVYKPDEPAPAPATSAEPLERCPECGGPIFVRGNGTIVAHYGGGIDPNRCKASETKFVRAALRQPGTPATSDLRDTAEKLLAQVDEIIEGVVRCGACGGKFSHRKDCKLIAACDGVRAALEATAPATSAEIEIRLDERKMCAFHNEREDCRCFHCRRIRELAALRQPGTPAEEKK